MKKFYLVLIIISVLILVLAASFSFYAEKRLEASRNPVLKTKIDLKSLPPDILARFERRARLLESVAYGSKNAKTEQERASAFRVWFQLGMTRKMVNDYRGAAEAWIEASKMSPENSAPFANLADLYTYFLKDYAKAEEAHNKALQLFSTVDNYRNFADFYQVSLSADKTKQAERVEKIILQGLRVYPNHVDLLSYLGSYFYDLGQKEKAIEYLEKLLSADPDHAGAREKLDKLKK